MAYRKQKEVFLAGSLNLLAPGDKVSPEDSLVLDNWRTDQAGMLLKRPGITQYASPAGGELHSILYTDAATYYGRAGSLYRDSTSVASGFDASRLGLVEYQDVVWVMNRAKQGRASAAGLTTWTPAPPTTAPNTTADGTAAQPIGVFDGSNPWTVTGVSGTLTETLGTPTVTVNSGSRTVTASGTSWTSSLLNPPALPLLLVIEYAPGVYHTARVFTIDSTTQLTLLDAFPFASGSYPATLKKDYLTSRYIFGNTLTIERPASVATPYTAVAEQTWATSVDMNIGGEGAATDVFRFTLGIYGPSGTILPDRFRVEFRDAADRLAWVESTLGVAVLNYNNNVSKVRSDFTTAPSFDWGAVKKMRLEVDCDQGCVLWHQWPELVYGYSAAAGDWTYYVTFGTARNEESNPSPESVPITIRGGRVSITGIPVGPAGTVRRHLYRFQPGFSTPLRVATIEDNTTTTYTDSRPAGQVIFDNIALSFDRDPAPAARGCIFFEGRIVAFSSWAFPARCWWTPIAEPYYFPGSDAIAEIEGGNWQDVGADSDPIIWASARQHMLVLYKRHSIWRYAGDPDEVEPEHTSAKRGLVGEQGLVSAGGEDYFVSDDGVFRFNGDYETDISMQIRPLFEGRSVEVASGVTYPPVDRANIHECALGYYRNRLYFSYPKQGSTANNAVLVYDLLFGRWYVHRASASPGFTAFGEAPSAGLLGGTSGGAAYQIEGTAQSDQGGAAVPLVWQSRYLNQGLFDNPKRYGELVVQHRTHLAAEPACTLTVKLLFDDGAESLTLGTISSSVRTKTAFPLNNGEGLERENVSLRIEGDSQASTAIYSAFLHWYPVERRAKAFDTDVVDLGTAEVKQVERFEAELTSASSWDWKLYSDIPGLAVAQRTTGSLAGAAARQVQQVGLSSLIDGRRFRLVATGTQFQLHGLRMRMRAIAAYIVAGVPWVSRVMDFGTPGPKELYEVELEYESNSGGTLTVDSDLPGNVLTLRATRTLPAAALPRTITLSLAGVEGRLFQWSITATTTLKVHRLRVKLRPIGVYVDGASGAMWETQALGFGHELCTLFREVELDCDTSGAMTFRLLTDRPGENLVERVAEGFNTEATTTGRRRVQIRCPGTAKGHLAKFRIDGVNTLKLYGGKVLHKPIGLAGVTPWRWTPLPIPPTPDSWQSVAVDGMGETSDWVWVSLPVDAIE